MAFLNSISNSLSKAQNFLAGDWGKLQKIIGNEQTAKLFLKGSKEVAMKRVLAYFKGQIVKNIRSSGNLAGKPFKPLKPGTLSRKGKNKFKPLIDIGELIGGINIKFFNGNTGFVGIKRGDVHSKAHKSLADIGEIHEFGALIPGGEIPKRSFIGPVLNRFKEDAGKIYSKSLEEKFK